MMRPENSIRTQDKHYISYPFYRALEDVRYEMTAATREAKQTAPASTSQNIQANAKSGNIYAEKPINSWAALIQNPPKAEATWHAPNTNNPNDFARNPASEKPADSKANPPQNSGKGQGKTEITRITMQPDGTIKVERSEQPSPTGKDEKVTQMA